MRAECNVVKTRPCEPGDLAAAERIFREAFGTAQNAPDLARYWEDRNYVRSRWTADPGGAIVAEVGGEVVGLAMAVSWGSVAVFGPLAVDPNYWNRGIGGVLLQEMLKNPRMRDARLQALCTGAGSTSNVRLYQRFDFWPRFLIPILLKQVPARAGHGEERADRYSALGVEAKREMLRECAALTGGIFEGLDVSHEILSVERQNLGDTLVCRGLSKLDSFAVCHCGGGTEAGAETCYVKFAAARSAEAFSVMLSTVEEFTRSQGMERISAGVNAGRIGAYRQLLARGFRAVSHSVAMQRKSSAAYDGPEVFVIDDWR